MSLVTSDVSKSYDGLKVLSHLSLTVGSGELVSLVGPSGCGKSTLLNILSGLDKPDAGTIEMDLTGRTSYMMQDPLLLPWRTLAENALLGIELSSGRSRENRVLVERYFTAFDLVGASTAYPSAASGGMKQRVALIRTLVTMPKNLLLDEPFSSLDFDVKLKIQRYLIDYLEKNGMTTLLVTHDIEDAIALSDKVIILSDKPARIKAIIPIDFGLVRRDPIGARKSPLFSEYFSHIWDEIKYLDGEGQPTAIH
jgi:NitT/TauT family transport system ATP-binding protein